MDNSWRAQLDTVYEEKTRSNRYFLLPIFIGIFGGIVAYFVLRHDDPEKARNCLYLGLGLTGMNLVFSTVFGMGVIDTSESFPDLASLSRLNILLWLAVIDTIVDGFRAMLGL